MKGQNAVEKGPTYDRQLLLGDMKRNAVLELWEVQRYGIDSYGDADYPAGMRRVSAYWGGPRSNVRVTG